MRIFYFSLFFIGILVAGSCPPIDFPSPGFSIYTSSSTIRFYCGEGTRLVGPTQVSCIALASGVEVWSSAPPLCASVTCAAAALSAPAFGSLTFLNLVDNSTAGEYPVDTLVAVSCSLGYALSSAAAASLRCSADGSWSSAVPRCVSIPANGCVHPGSPMHGWTIPSTSSASAGDLLPIGSTLQFSCASGFSVIGEHSATCRGGVSQWSAPPPLCSPQQCSAPPPSGVAGVVISSPLLPVHTVYTLYTPASWPPTRVTYPVGSTVTFLCASPYELRSQPVGTCLPVAVAPHQTPAASDTANTAPAALQFQTSVAVFVPLRGLCLVPPSQQCGEPGAPAGGWRVLSPPGSTALSLANLKTADFLATSAVDRSARYALGARVQWGCHAGWHLIGSENAECTSVGWSATLPSCVLTTCAPAVAPAGGAAVGCTTPSTAAGITSGSIALQLSCALGAYTRFYCHSSRQLIGSSTSICTPTGSGGDLTPHAPQCSEPLPAGVCRSPSLSQGVLMAILSAVDPSSAGSPLTWTPACPGDRCNTGDVAFVRCLGTYALSSAGVSFRLPESQAFADVVYGAGVVPLECSATGSWLPEIPSCRVPACALSPHQDVDIVSPVNLIVPSRVASSTGTSISVPPQVQLHLGCPEGLSEPAAGLAACMYSGAGSAILVPSPSLPQCRSTPHGCAAIDSLPHGRVVGTPPSLPDHSHPFGSVGRIECNYGYYPSTAGNFKSENLASVAFGTAVEVLCTNSSHWSSAIPYCLPLACPVPIIPDDENVVVTAVERPLNVQSRFLDSNISSSALPSILRYNVAIGSASFPIGTVLRYKCLQGQLSGASSASCDARLSRTAGPSTFTAVWTELPPRCLGTFSGSCAAPAAPLHGSVLVEYNGITIGLSDSPLPVGAWATWSCNSGYAIKGSSISVCLESHSSQPGSWSAPLPRCEPRHCAAPPDISSGYVRDAGSSTSVPSGAVISYGCHIGYNLLGESSYVCASDGLWRGVKSTAVLGDPPSCLSVPVCPDVVTPVGGFLSPTTHNTAFYPGDRVTFGCIEGRKMIGVDSITCTPALVWSDAPPICAMVVLSPSETPTFVLSTPDNITHPVPSTVPASVSPSSSKAGLNKVSILVIAVVVGVTVCFAVIGGFVAVKQWYRRRSAKATTRLSSSQHVDVSDDDGDSIVHRKAYRDAVFDTPDLGHENHVRKFLARDFSADQVTSSPAPDHDTPPAPRLDDATVPTTSRRCRFSPAAESIDDAVSPSSNQSVSSSRLALAHLSPMVPQIDTSSALPHSEFSVVKSGIDDVDASDLMTMEFLTGVGRIAPAAENPKSEVSDGSPSPPLRTLMRAMPGKQAPGRPLHAMFNAIGVPHDALNRPRYSLFDYGALDEDD